MVRAIVAAGDVQRVVQVAELDSAFGVARPFEPQSREGSVLIESGLGSPVGVVEVEERLVPNYKTQAGKSIERTLGSNQLAKSPAQIIARFQKPLFDSGPRCKCPLAICIRPSDLLPDSMFFELDTHNGIGVNPCVTDPGHRMFGYFDADSRPHNALIVATGVIQEA